MIPYAGVGFGPLQLQGDIELLDRGEDVDARKNGFIVLGGAEVRLMRWVGVSVDVHKTQHQRHLGRRASRRNSARTIWAGPLPHSHDGRAVSWPQRCGVSQRLAEILRGAALGRYERELRQQTAELNDLFLLLCFMEAAALPNPATLYLLEVYPYLLEQFHHWHRRMGIEHSPIGSLPCC